MLCYVVSQIITGIAVALPLPVRITGHGRKYDPKRDQDQNRQKGYPMLHPGGAPLAKIHFTLYDLPNADFFRGCADFF